MIDLPIYFYLPIYTITYLYWIFYLGNEGINLSTIILSAIMTAIVGTMLNIAVFTIGMLFMVLYLTNSFIVSVVLGIVIGYFVANYWRKI